MSIEFKYDESDFKRPNLLGEGHIKIQVEKDFKYYFGSFCSGVVNSISFFIFPYDKEYPKSPVVREFMEFKDNSQIAYSFGFFGIPLGCIINQMGNHYIYPEQIMDYINIQNLGIAFVATNLITYSVKKFNDRIKKKNLEEKIIIIEGIEFSNPANDNFQLL